MSQVIVTNDVLKTKRDATAVQEHKISREDMFRRWRRNDITGKDPIAAGVGLAVTPILGLWAFLTGIMVVMLTIIRFVFKGLGAVIGGTKNLITGRPGSP